MVDTRKLYDLTAQEKEHLRKLGFIEQGIGYAKPNGSPAKKEDIFKALKTPITAGSTTTQNYIFSKILTRAAEQRIIPNKTAEARKWFRDKAQNYRGNRIQRDNLFQNSITTNNASPANPGRMFMFSYDAKTKEKLPYWDAFPLIFMVGPAAGGFYGINLHYLPPVLRAKLMDALYTITNNQRYDDTTKIKLSYQVLKSTSNLGLFKPCFKHYLSSHVKSKFILVPASEWDIALMLPLQKWVGATSEKVWEDSKKMVGG